MKKSMLKELAQLIKHYEQGSSSYYVGASDALRSFLESNGFACCYRGGNFVVYDRNGLEVVRV